MPDQGEAWKSAPGLAPGIEKLRTWNGELEVADFKQFRRNVLQLESRQLLKLFCELLKDHVVIVPSLAEVVGIAVSTVPAAVVAGDGEIVGKRVDE